MRGETRNKEEDLSLKIASRFMELREGNSFVEIWSNQEVVERLKSFLFLQFSVNSVISVAGPYLVPVLS